MEDRILDMRQKIQIGQRGSDVGNAKVLISYGGPNVRHETKSLNRLRRIRCLVIVKSQHIKIDQMFSKIRVQPL